MNLHRLLPSILLAATLSAQSTTRNIRVPQTAGATTGIQVGGEVEGPTASSGIVPVRERLTWGNQGNNIPFSWFPTRYQQVFFGKELPKVRIMNWLSLRQDNSYARIKGEVIDVELKLGFTGYTPWNITTGFDSNYDQKGYPPTMVFKRRLVNLPDFSLVKATNPMSFPVTFKFDRPFVWAQVGSWNLLIEIVTYGHKAKTATFTYPMDAAVGSTTTRIYAAKDIHAKIGVREIGTGLVMNFEKELSAVGFYMLNGMPCRGSVGYPTFTNKGFPTIDQSYSLYLHTVPQNSVGALLTGSRRLRVDLKSVGAPSCFLLTSPDHLTLFSTGAYGFVPLELRVPNSKSLVGIRYQQQFMILDPAANQLGLTFSSAAEARIGG